MRRVSLNESILTSKDDAQVACIHQIHVTMLSHTTVILVSWKPDFKQTLTDVGEARGAAVCNSVREEDG